MFYLFVYYLNGANNNNNNNDYNEFYINDVMKTVGDTIDESLKSSPKNSEVHSYKGELYFTSGYIALALKEFELVTEYEPINE